MLGRGLVSRAGAYAVFALGFWLLFQGFDRPNILIGVLGGAGILLGMYLLVGVGKTNPYRPAAGADESMPPQTEQETGHEPLDTHDRE